MQASTVDTRLPAVYGVGVYWFTVANLGAGVSFLLPVLQIVSDINSLFSCIVRYKNQR